MTRETGSLPDIDDPDRCLVNCMAQRDTHAVEALYARHWRVLLAYLIQQVSDYQLAEELLQDVMLAAWNGAATFRGECKVLTWLMAIARKRAITARQRQAQATIPLDEDTSFMSNQTLQGPHDEVLTALNQLPHAERETVILIFYYNLSGSDVAIVMQVPEGTVRSRLRRAKTRLHKLLCEQEAANA